MKFLLHFLILFSFSSIAQKVSLKEGFLEDFEILKTSILENHPLMDVYITKKEFEILCSEEKANIEANPNYSQFYFSLSKLTASLKCGHTYVNISESYKNELFKNGKLPFKIKIIADQIFVVKVLDEKYKSLLGKEIISFSGITFGQLYGQTNVGISRDGNNQAYAFWKMEEKLDLYLKLLLQNPEKIKVETTEEVIEVPFLLMPEQKIVESEIEFKFLDKKRKTAYLKIPHFDDGKSKIKSALKAVDNDSCQNMIIDLRNNYGGNGNIASFLICHFIDTSFVIDFEKKNNKIFYKKHFGGQQGLLISNKVSQKNQETAVYSFPVKAAKKLNKKLFVLVNSGTFSAAAYAASVLKYKCNAEIIGSQSGGNEFGIGGGIISRITLPNSGFTVKFPQYRWVFNTVKNDRAKGIIPHISIEYFLEDYLNDIDKEMEYLKNIF